MNAERRRSERVLLCFGCGYVGTALARLLLAEGGWRVVGTARSDEGAARIKAAGASARIWPGSNLSADLKEATHILVSVPPGEAGDPVLERESRRIKSRDAPPEWLGYLSTTAVYGDRSGGWVDERAPPLPATERGRLRVLAESGWRELAGASGMPCRVFRLAGIYGPGRGPIAQLLAGRSRIIVKPNQVFNRAHVDDIAAALRASMENPPQEETYNICDDLPEAPDVVIRHAAELLGMPEPEPVRFEQADLSPMARSFYSECKRVENKRMKRDLLPKLAHPDYRSGLAAIAAAHGESDRRGARAGAGSGG